MARIDDQGNLVYDEDPYAAPPPIRQSTDPADPFRVDNPEDPQAKDGTTDFTARNRTTVGQPNPVVTPPPSTGPTKPGGGNINDPAYLDSLLSYYGSQPGVNPSVKNDPGYWKQAVSSGRFNGDENYLIQRFFQPEGPAEGGTGQTGTNTNQPPPPPGTNTGPSSDPFASPTGDSSGLSGFLANLLAQQASSRSTVNAQRQSVLDRLNKLADSYSTPVTADDPIISGPTQAYTGQVNRSVNDFRKTAAERAYAEGVPTGAFDSQIGESEMSGGRAIGDFQSELMQNELVSRRQNLMDTLNSSASVLNSQDTSDLQNRIASIDSILESRGLDITDKGTTGSLNLQDKLGTGQLNLDASGQALQGALGFSSLDLQNLLGLSSLDLQKTLGTGALNNQSTSISNQNKQFYDQFGLTSANQATTLDQLLASLLVGG